MQNGSWTALVSISCKILGMFVLYYKHTLSTDFALFDGYNQFVPLVFDQIFYKSSNDVPKILLQNVVSTTPSHYSC